MFVNVFPLHFRLLWFKLIYPGVFWLYTPIARQASSPKDPCCIQRLNLYKYFRILQRIISFSGGIDHWKETHRCEVKIYHKSAKAWHHQRGIYAIKCILRYYKLEVILENGNKWQENIKQIKSNALSFWILITESHNCRWSNGWIPRSGVRSKFARKNTQRI